MDGNLHAASIQLLACYTQLSVGSGCRLIDLGFLRASMRTLGEDP
jgi:hypothetical protein